MSLFGAQNKPSLGLNTNLQQPTFGSFGASQPPANETQPNQGGSLFGSSLQPPQQQQQQQAQSFGGSTRPLWQAGNSTPPRQKTIPEQMHTLLSKWSPESDQCLFQTYFYNTVPSATVPYYGPAPGEDEQKWEEALAKKPTEDSIPVICKGFQALGSRLRVQVQVVANMQVRLHEINNSLTAMLQKHDLELSVKAADARRRHTALSRRCLTLATKIQVLRNRGYSMDGAEEDFKKKLMELERHAFDPALNARQEEIWAKMVSIKERARFLQEETEKVKGSSSGGGTQGSPEKLDEEDLRIAKKVLEGFDSQISHLQKQLEEVKKDFEAWEGK